jgi:hypothetical protein
MLFHETPFSRRDEKAAIWRTYRETIRIEREFRNQDNFAARFEVGMENVMFFNILSPRSKARDLI